MTDMNTEGVVLNRWKGWRAEGPTCLEMPKSEHCERMPTFPS